MPRRLRACGALGCEWPELTTIRAHTATKSDGTVLERPPPIAMPASQYADLVTVLNNLQSSRPFTTPAEYSPIWLASKPAVRLSDLCAHSEHFGCSFDLAAAEATGIIFRGGKPPCDEWIMLASSAFERKPPNYAIPLLPPASLREHSSSVTGMTSSVAASPACFTAPPHIAENLETRQFRQLAADLRDWLIASPPPREIVLSRSGLVPFLTSEAITHAYACNPPTAAHVRHAVEVFGAANQLKCSSSPARNNGATVVRLATIPAINRMRPRCFGEWSEQPDLSSTPTRHLITDEDGTLGAIRYCSRVTILCRH